MKRIITLTLLITVLSTLSLGQKATPKHPVENFFMSGISAFNAHDLDGFMKQFDKKIEMYTPTGWLRGHKSVRERFAQTFKQFPNVRMEIEDLRVREVVPGTAVTDFKWRVFPMGQGPAFHGVGSGVYILRKGRWSEVLEHETVERVDEGLSTGAR
ncbi:hypothetical protein BH20ACI2_BH20ACI2_08280 [soil metagenome]